MVSFHNVRFPDFLARVAGSSTSFLTNIIDSPSGFEVRKIERTSAIRKYSIKQIKCTSIDYNKFISFFHARNGAGYAFRFKDYFDYKARNEKISIIDRVYPTKYYKDELKDYVRSNIFIIPETLEVKHLTTKLEFLQDKKGEFLLQEKFTSPTEVSINFEFDVIVRFNQDEVISYLDKDGGIVIENIELIEVIL